MARKDCEPRSFSAEKTLYGRSISRLGIPLLGLNEMGRAERMNSLDERNGRQGALVT